VKVRHALRESERAAIPSQRHPIRGYRQAEFVGLVSLAPTERIT
jgi:hypothetical protein